MILFSKLKKSTAILRKSDFDDAYSKHKKIQSYMSKADKIAVNILATQQASPAKSTMKGYMTSHRSATTLPPITDLKTKRQSVPGAFTPKLGFSLADTHNNNGSRQLLKIKTPDQAHATHS